jgi:hypothetical protein
MTSRLRRRDKRLVLAIVIIVVAAAGVAYAAIPSSTGVISGCYSNRTGALRVIDAEAGMTCTSRETPISWNQQGPPAQPPGPQAITVDCAAGEKVSDALAQSANAPSVTITIKGTCTEAVVINRDDVMLKSFAPGDGLQAPSADATVLALFAAHRTRLQQLTLRGGSTGLAAFGGSIFSAADLHVASATQNAVTVGTGATGNLGNPTIEDSGTGLNVFGGNLSAFGGTISGSVTGVNAGNGGAVTLTGGLVLSDSSFHGVVAGPGGSVAINGATVRNSGNTGAYAFGGSISVFGDASVIQGSTFAGLSAEDGGSASLAGGARSANNGAGVVATGGALLIQDGAIVENNTGGGVMIFAASSLRMRGGAIIRGNGSHGIHASDTSVASFGDGTTQIVDNDGWGIVCDSAPSVALISGNPGTVTGNTSGQVSCPNAAP